MNSSTPATPPTREELESLWLAHRGWVAAIILADRPDADVDDLLQEVALAVVRDVGSLRDRGAFRSWLRAVTRNVLRMAGRRRQRASRETAVELDELPDPNSLDDGERGVAVERVADTLALLGELPAHYREPLLLRSAQGRSTAEIAAILEVPVATVETRLVRARRRLRQLVRQRQHAESVTASMTDDKEVRR